VNEHAAASLFPLMSSDELLQLAEDIQAHGLLEPIALHDGAVLDGRNRLRACELVGVEPRYVTAPLGELSPSEWVVSHNLLRRHLTVAQRAALALDLLPRLEEEARERMLAGNPSPKTDEGRSDEKAAALVGVGRTAVAQAKAVQNRAPEIIDRMRSGAVATVAAAVREAGFETGPHGNNGLGVGALDTGARSSDGRSKPVYFGKGDKWQEATEPLKRYLAGRKKRDYSYSDIAPREARKRVQMIDRLLEGLQASRADLEPRSHDYRLTA
jgi:hypothetical protein